MKKQNFLNKLKKEVKLEIIDPSEEICSSYLEKANNCLKSTKLLLKNHLYENSVSMAYYTMYNSLTALFFKVGIKCKNHTGLILSFKLLFKKKWLSDTISFAKKERIDKEYYITSKEDFILTEEIVKDMFSKAENFLLHMKLLIQQINLEEIEKIMMKFKKL